MLHEFIKASGLKSEQDFYKKYPDEASFLKNFLNLKK